MNKIFKVIWNQATQSWVAVSELARGYIKSSSNKNKVELSSKVVIALALGGAIVPNLYAASAITNTSNVFIETQNSGHKNIIIGDTADRGQSKLTAIFGESYGYGSSYANKLSGDTTGTNNIIIGQNAIGSGDGGVILGNGARTWGSGQGNGVHQIAIGTDAVAGGMRSVSIGADSGTGAEYAVAVGHKAFAPRAQSVALGYSAIASQMHSISIGAESKSLGSGSIVLGRNSTADKSDTIAIGRSSSATANNAVVLGGAAEATLANSIALGVFSKTDADAVDARALTVNGHNFGSTTGQGRAGYVVSVGKSGTERQIKNVASGQVTANSTDAINGSQLFAVTKGILEKTLTFAGNSGNTTRVLGDTLTISGAGTTAGNYSSKNIKTAVTDGKVEITIADNPEFTSITTTEAINAAGLTVGANKTVDMGGNKVTNVAAGSAGTDAVNVNQLNEVRNNTFKLTTNNGSTSTQTLNQSGGLSFGVKGDNTYITSNATGSDVTISLSDDAKSKLDNAAKNDLSNITQDGKNAIATAAQNATLTYKSNSTVSKTTTLATGLDFKNTNGLTITAKDGGVVEFGLDSTISDSIANAAKNDLSNITPAGKTAIVDAAKDSIVGAKTKVTSSDNSITVGKTESTDLNPNIYDISINTNKLKTDLADTFAKNDASNLTPDNATAWRNALGVQSATDTNTAINAIGNNTLKLSGNTGNTDTQALNKNNGLTFGVKGDGTYLTSNATGSDVTIDLSATAKAKLDNAADNNLSNLTDAGKNVISAAAKGAVNIENGTNTVASSREENGVKILKVDVNKDSLKTDLADTFAKNDATNLTDDNVNAWRNKLNVMNADQVTAAVNAAGWTLKANSEATGERINNNGEVKFIDGANINITRSGNEITVKTVANPEFTSVKTDTLNVTGGATIGGALNANGGLTVAAGQNVNMGGNAITGVAKGTNDTDAANLENVKELVSGSFWKLGHAAATDGEVESGSSATDEEMNPNDKLTLQAGKNIKIKRENGVVTYSTKDNVSFSDLAVSGTSTLTNLTVNGNTTFNKGFTVAGGQTVDMGGNKVTNVGNATDDKDAVNLEVLKGKVKELSDTLTALGLDFSGNTGETSRDLGQKLAIQGSATTAGDYSSKNVKTVATEGKIEIQIAENPEFNAVKAETLNVTGGATIGGALNANGGLTVAAGKTVDMGGNKVTNVAKGSADTDAANLENVKELVSGSFWKLGHAADAEGEADAASSADDEEINPTEKLTLKAGKNIKIKREAGVVTYSTKDNASFTGLEVTGASTLNNLTVNGKTEFNDGFTVAANKTIDMGGNAVTNVGDAKNGKDAVNLDVLNAKVEKLQGDLTALGLNFGANEGETSRDLGEKLAIEGSGTTSGAYSSKNVKTVATDGKIEIQIADNPEFTGVKTDTLTVTGDASVAGMLNANGGLTVAAGKTVDMGGNKVTNVAEGSADTDAANIKNVKDLLAGSSWKLGHGTVDGGEEETGSSTDDEDINPEDKLTLQAGKNIKIKRLNGTVAYSTKDDVSFTTLGVTGASTLNNLTVNGDTLFNKGFRVASNQTVDMGGNRVTNVGDATEQGDAVNLKVLTDKLTSLENTLTALGLKFTANQGDEVSRNLGTSLAIEGEATTTGDYSGKNVKTETTEGKINIKFAENPEFNDVKANTLNVTGDATIGGTLTANGGLTVAAGQNVDMGGNKISNVGAGTEDTDAANIKNVKDMLANSSWKLGHGSVDGGEVETGSSATDEDMNPNDKLTLQAGKNIKIKRENGTVTYSTKDDVSFTSLEVTGESKLGHTTFNEGFTVAANKPVDMGGNRVTNVGDATDDKDAVNLNVLKNKVKELENTLTALGMKFQGNEGGEISRDLGTTLNIEGDATTQGDYSAKNVKTVAEGGKLKIQIAENPEFTDVKAETLNVTGDTTIGGALNANGGLTVATGKDVNMGGNRVQGVGDAVEETDAVNFKQLTATNNEIAKGWTITTSKSGTGEVTGTSDEKINMGETITIDAGNNVHITQTGNTISISTSSTPKFDSLTVGGKDNSSFTVEKGTSINMGGNAVDGVGDGEISPTSTQAVNGRQIFALTGGQGAPDTKTVTIDGVEYENVVVDDAGKPLLTTYNVSGQKEHIQNSVITAINHMNKEGIKFFHVNDGRTEGRPAEQGANQEDSSAAGKYAAAVGFNASATGESAVALGKGSTASGKNSISIGAHDETTKKKTTAEGENSIALGYGTQVTGKNSISVGTGNIVRGSGSGAFGDPSIIDSDNSYSVGNNNNIASDQSDVFILGNSVSNTSSNSVFLGSNTGYVEDGKTTKGKSEYLSETIGGQTYNYAGGKASEVVGVVSVGNISKDQSGATVLQTRRIQNLSPGLISKDSTDAINGSQLYAVMNDSAKLRSQVADMDSRLSSGIAGAVATAGLVQAFNPNDSLLAIGGGTYRGSSAIAVGYSRVSDNGRVIIKVTGSANNYGDYTGSASVGFKF